METLWKGEPGSPERDIKAKYVKETGGILDTLLMLKDTAVLKIGENGECNILNYDLLPISIRRKDLTINHFYMDWVYGRAMPMGRSNAKDILSTLQVAQNPAKICFASYAVSLTDCYWVKEDEDAITWSEISPYRNKLSKELASVALYGSSSMRLGKIYTPELVTQGVNAKCWVKENNNIYMYKIAKSEIAASEILDTLGITHVTYETADNLTVESPDERIRLEYIESINEKIVKSKLIATEDISLVSFEDFRLMAEREQLNAFELAKTINRHAYFEMQIADYILNNPDRHSQNWGFFMDNHTGKIFDIYPLMDHDRAFSERTNIISQTVEENVTLEYAAIVAQQELSLDYSSLLEMKRPALLEEIKWNMLTERIAILERKSSIFGTLIKNGFKPNMELIDKIDSVSGNRLFSQESLHRVKACYHGQKSIKTEEEIIIKQIGEELKQQEILMNNADELFMER